jgi:hypothetical protein
VLRQFVGFSEASTMLDSDTEGLRQALELGLGDRLPVYVYAAGEGFPACFTGFGVSSKYEWVDGPMCTVSIDGFGEFIDDGSGIEWLEDPFCSVTATYEDTRQSTSEFILNIQGYIRVMPGVLRNCARSGNYIGVSDVGPNSWWAATSPVPKASSGEPQVQLMLLPKPETAWSYVPKLKDLMFRVSDIDALKSSRMHAQTNSEKDSIDPRTETSLLVIIGALARKAKLDLTQPYAAADEVVAWLELEGIKLSKNNIGNHFKEVPEAMNSRKK